MKIKSIFRYDSVQGKLRLFRVMWDVGVVGDGQGYSRKIAVSVRPKLLGFSRSADEWRLMLLGVDVHSVKSFGGRFV